MGGQAAVIVEHDNWVCEDDHRRMGECDAPDTCGCRCHMRPEERLEYMGDLAAPGGAPGE